MEEKKLIVWGPLYEIGHKEIDDQHKKLVDLINEFYDAFLNAEANIKVIEIVQRVIDYTVYHFIAEEDLFMNIEYPNTERHLETHKTFVNKLKIFKKQLDEGSIVISYELMTFLRDWLSDHIMGEDKELVKYL